jgi:substrate-binding protein of zinc uptake complex component A
VATLPDLYVLPRAVASELATIDLIACFGQNPHDMEIRPSQILMVRRAEVLIRNGLEEDAWIDVMMQRAANPRTASRTSITSSAPSPPRSSKPGAQPFRMYAGTSGVRKSSRGGAKMSITSVSSRNHASCSTPPGITARSPGPQIL